MSGNQRNHATNPNQGFYRPHGNPHFGQRNHRVPFNPEYPPLGMHSQHAPVHVPHRNPNWGHKNPHVPFNHVPTPLGTNRPHQTLPPHQRNPSWRHPHVPFNPAFPPSGRQHPHPPVHAPQRNPNWGHKNPHVPFNRVPPRQGRNPQYSPAPTPHTNPNWGPKNNNVPHKPNQENVAASEAQASIEKAEDIKKEISNLRNQLMEKDAYLSKLKEEKRAARRDRGDKLHRLNVKNTKLEREVKFRIHCEHKLVTLKEELTDLNEAAEAKQPECGEREKEAHIQALNKLALLKKELQEKTLYNLQLAQRLKLEEDAEKDLKQKMEDIQIPLETAVNGISRKPAQSFSANKVQLSVETQKKVSEPEKVNKQVEAEESGMVLAPQDLNGWPQNYLSKPEVVLEQVEYERTDAIIAPQTENEEPQNAASELHVVSEQEEAEETDTTILDFLDTGEAQGLEISQEEVSPPSPSDPVPAIESGHEDREEPEALPSEQSGAKKPSLWKRFKNLLKPRHRNQRDKENQG